MSASTLKNPVKNLSTKREKVQAVSPIGGSLDPITPYVWITELEYASLHGLHRQTLSNWRAQDRKLGLSEARPGFPVYKRFGAAVRYRVEKEEIQSRSGSAA